MVITRWYWDDGSSLKKSRWIWTKDRIIKPRKILYAPSTPGEMVCCYLFRRLSGVARGRSGISLKIYYIRVRRVGTCECHMGWHLLTHAKFESVGAVERVWSWGKADARWEKRVPTLTHDFYSSRVLYEELRRSYSVVASRSSLLNLSRRAVGMYKWEEWLESLFGPVHERRKTVVILYTITSPHCVIVAFSWPQK